MLLAGFVLSSSVVFIPAGIVSIFVFSTALNIYNCHKFTVIAHHMEGLFETAKNQLQLEATGFAVIPYIQGVTRPIKRVLNSHNVKVALKPFRLWGIFSPNLRILSRKNNEPKLFLLFLAMTVTTNTSDRPNVSLVHV